MIGRAPEPVRYNAYLEVWEFEGRAVTRELLEDVGWARAWRQAAAPPLDLVGARRFWLSVLLAAQLLLLVAPARVLPCVQLSTVPDRPPTVLLCEHPTRGMILMVPTTRPPR